MNNKECEIHMKEGRGYLKDWEKIVTNSKEIMLIIQYPDTEIEVPPNHRQLYMKSIDLVKNLNSIRNACEDTTTDSKDKNCAIKYQKLADMC